MAGSNNTKQAFWIALGGIFSNSIAIVSAMILSRYFSKTDYGTYKQVIYIYSSCQIVFTLGLPHAFSHFLPRIPIEQARQTISKITNIFYVLGGVFSLLLFAGSSYIATLFNNPDLSLALKIYSPVALFMLPTMGLEGILSTYRKTQYIAIYNIVTRTFTLLCVVFPVIIFHCSYVMAIWGLVISSFITFLLAIYLKFLPVRNCGKEKSSLSYQAIFQFSFPLLLASIWGALINSTDQFFISHFWGTETFAEFSNGAIELPFVGMVVGAAATVLTPLFSKGFSENNKENILALWRSSFVKGAMILYPIAIFCIFFAKPIMIVMYGSQYADSAPYFQIKLLLTFFKVISCVPLLLGIGATKLYSNIHMFGFFFLILAEYLIARCGASPFCVTGVHVCVSITFILIFMRYIAKYIKVRLIDLIPFITIIKIAIFSIATSALCSLIINGIGINCGLLMLCLGFTGFSLMYGVLCFLFNINYWCIVKPLFSR